MYKAWGRLHNYLCASQKVWILRAYSSNIYVYILQIKVKFLAAFLYLNEKPKPAIREKAQLQSSTSGLTLNGTLCDYEIICEEKKFSCHKSVLASNSSVFKVNN